MRILLSRLAFFLLCLTLSTVALAEAPHLVSYQGKLTDSDGEPVPDGAYQLTFGVYETATGGSPLWSETHDNVAVVDGVFSLILGSTEPLDDAVLAGTERYLEVGFDGTAVLPRTRLTSSAYALRVATIDGTTGGDVIGPLVVGTEASGVAGLSTDEAAALAEARVVISVAGDSPSISLWEPVDSKLRAGAGSSKKIEFRREGIIMFGETEADTNLYVAPNGDIVGVGQITMGENSSSGTETSVLGFGNTADGDSSSIAGGSANVTTGTISVISGGHANTANGEGSTVGGGAYNTADGNYSTIAGGYNNTAAGDFATVTGGTENEATGIGAQAGGFRAKASNDGSFVWADQTDADFASTADDQFLIRAGGGVGIGTDSPVGQLDVAGPGGDLSVNLPGDAISSPEMLDEPGIASDQSSADITLIQGSSIVQDLTSTTITIPADGYVVVRGTATLAVQGASAANQAHLQIDDAPGGGLISPYYVTAGNGDYDSPNRVHYFAMAVERVFMLSAGTYTFYLEGMAHQNNDADANSVMERPFIIAAYFPTAYGTVSSSSATRIER